MLRSIGYIFLITIMACWRVSPAQNHEIDSLKQRVSTASTDTNTVKDLVALSWKLRNAGRSDSCIVYSKKARELAEQLNFKKQLGKSLTISGIAFQDLGEYDSARVYYISSLKVRESINDKKGVAACYNNLGLLFEAQGNYPKALEVLLKALQIREEIQDKPDMSATYNNIGTVYHGLKDLKEAETYFTKALKMKEELGDKQGMAMSYGNIGLMQEERNEHEMALKSYQRALELEKEVDFKMGIGDCYSNIGEVHHRLGGQSNNATDRQSNYKEAAKFYELSLQIREEIGDKQGIITSYSHLGSVLSALGDKKRAEILLVKALALARQLKEVYLLKGIYKGLTEVYTATGRHTEALAIYKLYIATSDTLNNETNTKRSVQLAMQYEFDKKETAARLEQEKKDELAAASKRRTLIVILSVAGFGLLVLIFAIFAYRSMVRKKIANFRIMKQKEIIEEKQVEILDSIYYARRIQRSLLTSERYIDKHLRRLLNQ